MEICNLVLLIDFEQANEGDISCILPINHFPLYMDNWITSAKYMYIS